MTIKKTQLYKFKYLRNVYIYMSGNGARSSKTSTKKIHNSSEGGKKRNKITSISNTVIQKVLHFTNP